MRLTRVFVVFLAADIKVFVEEQGALFSSSVTDQCTHLITTQKDIEKKGTKCEDYPAKSHIALVVYWMLTT
jgi:poly [ADP-ribose] polymerase